MSEVKLQLTRQPYRPSKESRETSAGRWQTPDQKWGFYRGLTGKWFIGVGREGWDSNIGIEGTKQTEWQTRQQFIDGNGLVSANFKTRQEAIEALALALSGIDPTTPLAKALGLAK